MKYFAGLDVFLEETAICIVDESGRIVKETRAASEPDTLSEALRKVGLPLGRVGLEACSLTAWLHDELRAEASRLSASRRVRLAADDLLVGVITPCFGLQSLVRLAVDHRRRRAGFAALLLPVEHQFDIMDGLEQEAARQFAEPAINRPPMAKVDRQHPPAAARTHHIAHRVDDLAEIDLARPAKRSWLRHQRRDPRPFLVRQIRRIPLGLPGDLGHPASGLICPHPKCESHSTLKRNPSDPVSKQSHRRATDKADDQSIRFTATESARMLL